MEFHPGQRVVRRGVGAPVGGGSQVSRTQSAIVLATVYVWAGEPRGLQLAHGVITDAVKISSIRARRRLEPPAAALETLSGADACELAVTAGRSPRRGRDPVPGVLRAPDPAARRRRPARS